MKTILNETLREKIISDIKIGLNYKDVCILNRINEDTFYTWIKKGERDVALNKKSQYAEFAESIKAAKLQMKQLCLTVIRKEIWDKVGDNIITNADMAKWYLMTKHKKEYGSLATGEDDDLILVNTNIDKSLTPIKELREIIAKKREDNANKQ